MNKLFIAFAIAFSSLSCSKVPDYLTTPKTPTGERTFYWIDNNNVIYCDSAYAIRFNNTIYAYKTTSLGRYYFEIKLNGIDRTSYDFNAAGNIFTYQKPSSTDVLRGISGKVDILTRPETTIQGVGTVYFANPNGRDSLTFLFDKLPIRN